MRYLITFPHDSEHKPFFTKWFEPENNFNADLKMNVYDLAENTFTTDGKVWQQIDVDHL